MKKVLATILLTISIILLTTAVVNAYTVPEEYMPQNLPFGGNNEVYKTEDGASTATIVILQVLSGSLLFFAAPLAVVVIVFAAWDLVMGSAETEKRDQAKKNITWAIIGLILILLSYTAVRAIIKVALETAELAPPGT
ncbi:MAG: hypothetical protein V1679_02365 [Candidatus Peregrinibacteria bacterium]